MRTGLRRILPVQNPDSSYDVAALNNLYAEAFESALQPTPSRRAPREMSLTSDQQASLSLQLQQLQALGDAVQDDPDALLELLRQLEQLHRTIQDGPFRASLPSDRNQLFELLQTMERSGGWPYIPRLQLRTFMDLLQRDSDPDNHPLAA